MYYVKRKSLKSLSTGSYSYSKHIPPAALIKERCSYEKSLANYKWLILVDTNGYEEGGIYKCQSVKQFPVVEIQVCRYNHKWIEGENTSVSVSCKFQCLQSTLTIYHH